MCYRFLHAIDIQRVLIETSSVLFRSKSVTESIGITSQRGGKFELTYCQN